MSDELADKLQKAEINSGILKVLKEHGITTMEGLLAKTDSEIDKLPLKPFQKKMLKKFCKDERKKEEQPQQQTQGGGSVRKLEVKDSSLDVGTAHSETESGFIIEEGEGAENVSVVKSTIDVETQEKGSCVSAVHTSGGQKRGPVEETKATFKRNKMTMSNVGTGSSQTGIKVKGNGNVRVKCTGNDMKMENKGNATRNRQVGVHISEGQGSTSLQSAGNQQTMENEDGASGNLQVGVVGAGGAAGSTSKGMATRSGTGGEQQRPGQGQHSDAQCRENQPQN